MPSIGRVSSVDREDHSSDNSRQIADQPAACQPRPDSCIGRGTGPLYGRTTWDASAGFGVVLEELPALPAFLPSLKPA